MSFVSYAQNFEDVMLWRAFKHIENGFYIDIGAQDPVVDSVSLAFYEHGWRGVHVEPTYYYSQKLKKNRPDELVKQIAIGSSDEKLEFYEFLGTGLSTADKKVAEQHEEDGFLATKTEVNSIALDDLLDSCDKKEIHWLKIDVEGFEKKVIESWVASEVRPWVLVIESTQPLTNIETHRDWEILILRKGYSFVYFDGLNRFYIHESHLELAQYYNCPPNVFDDFKLSGSASQPFYHLIKEEAKYRVELAEDKAQLAESEKNEALMQIRIIYSSNSWRITAPLRWAGNQYRALGEQGVKERLRLLNKKALNNARVFVTNRPKLKKILKILIVRSGLSYRIKQIFTVLKRNTSLRSSPEKVSKELVGLSPHARKIYHRLKRTAGKNKGQN